MSRERKRVSECESGDVMRKRKQKWERERKCKKVKGRLGDRNESIEKERERDSKRDIRGKDREKCYYKEREREKVRNRESKNSREDDVYNVVTNINKVIKRVASIVAQLVERYISNTRGPRFKSSHCQII